MLVYILIVNQALCVVLFSLEDYGLLLYVYHNPSKGYYHTHPGGGGVLPEILGTGVRPAYQNPYPIYDQNLQFPYPIYDLTKNLIPYL